MAALKEPAFFLELLLCIILIPIAILLAVSLLTKLFMIASLFLILIIELVNSAIEATVDSISLEHHPLAKQAKDMGSAAVLIALINAITIWAVVLIQYTTN